VRNSGHGVSPARIAAVTDAFDAAVQQQSRGRAAHIGAKARIRTLIESALRAIGRLDVFVHVQLRR
jgi:hypothetical protein